MSYSRDQRIQAMDSTLALALDELGDQEFQQGRFWTNQEPFDGVAKTTWIDLEQGECQLITLVHRLGGHVGFYLTGAGWRRALDVTGRLSDPEFETDLSSICKTLKSSVKSRNEEAYLYPSKVAQDAGVPEAFLTNVIDSRLIDHYFNIQGAEWESDGLIRVPINFGHRPL